MMMLECANAAGMDAQCEELARLGRCNADKTLLDTCRLSCTRCAPIPANVTGTSAYFFIRHLQAMFQRKHQIAG